MSVLDISPARLVFPPPFDRSTTNVIKLKNTTNDYVVFKVKTTSPKRYAVRPTLEVIPPNESKDIHVTLHGSKDPPTDQTKDSFLVQCFHQKDTPAASLKDIFQGVDPSEIVKYKIRCAFSNEEIIDEAQTTPTTSTVRPSIKDMNPSLFQSAFDFSGIQSHRDAESQSQPQESSTEEELQRLKTQLQKMKHENDKLQESLGRGKEEESESTRGLDEQSELTERPPPMNPILWCILALFTAVLGFLFGRFL